MNADRLLAHYERIADAPDAVPRLRRFILDVAVRGKLVDQDPNDEPASELLKRIAKEKARLVKVGEIRKPRDLAGGEDLPAFFEIPIYWHWVRLDGVGAIIGGGTPSANDTNNFADPGTGVPWLTPADLGGFSERFISRGARDLSENGLQTSSATLMPAGTVLFTSRAPIGYVAIAENPISTNQGFKSIVPYVPDCSRFIALAMKTFAPEIDAKAPGTTFREVSGKIVAGVSFPLPPLAEQHRIVAKVDELMALCDRLEKARAEREATRDRLSASSLARLDAPDPDPMVFRNHAAFALEHLTPLTTRRDQPKALRQTILNLAVRGKLVAQDPNDEPAAALLKRIAKEKARLVKAKKIRNPKQVPVIDAAECLFDAPRGWEWKRLSEISRKIHYGFTASANNMIDVVRLLRITDIHNNSVDWASVPGCEIGEKAIPQFKLEKGDILVARTGGTIGKSFLVQDVPAVVVFASYLVRVQGSHEMYDRYLKLFLESPTYWIQLQDGSKGTGQPNVNGQTLGKMLVPVPPLAQQHRIVAKVDELMALCDGLETSLTTCDDTRCRLLGAFLIEALEPSGSYASEQAERAAGHG